MSIFERAKEDWGRIVSDENEFGVAIKLVAPNLQMAEIIGLHTKHHMSIGTDGVAINGKNAHISFKEDVVYLANKDYKVRDSFGKVNLRNHKVIVKDSTGRNCSYDVKEWFQDETVGMIICILGDYKYCQ